MTPVPDSSQPDSPLSKTETGSTEADTSSNSPNGLTHSNYGSSQPNSSSTEESSQPYSDFASPAPVSQGNGDGNRIPGLEASTRLNAQSITTGQPSSPPISLIIGLAIAIMIVGLVIQNFWIGLAGALVALLVSLRIIWLAVRNILVELLSPEQRLLSVGILGAIVALIGLFQLNGWGVTVNGWLGQIDWEAVGASGEVFGALGQILIAVIAVYVAWRQYVISKDLTIQQNLITQQQTIDSYFQGISELVLDAEGLLEDWPQERAIAEGRTAAILSSVDAGGKAKVIRFLSRSRLLTPLKRDRLLGRAILDGTGGYQEDRDYGVRVIDLGVMLAGANLAGTDLRWTDLSEANLIRANLTRCDLVKANLARTILYDAMLGRADLMGARLFYGSIATASPRSRTIIPNYKTGAYTGVVIENADLTGVQRLSEAQRYYCCAWGGSKTRATVPGGCDGIPDLLQQQRSRGKGGDRGES